MEPKDVLAELVISQELIGGTSPAGASVSVKVTPEGFFHTGGLGGLGQSAEMLPPDHVARMFTDAFEPEALRAIFAHLRAVSEAL